MAAIGYTIVGGIDIGNLFTPRTSAKRADVGYQVAGSDISNLFEPRGSYPQFENTGYQSSGSDLSYFFRPGILTFNSGTLQSNGTHAAAGSSAVSVNILFNNTGACVVTFGGNSSGTVDTVDTSNMWARPAHAWFGLNHWIRATLTSGTAPSTGTMNTWLALSTNRNWTVARTQGEGVGTDTSTILFEISTSSSGSPVVASGTITITGNRT